VKKGQGSVSKRRRSKKCEKVQKGGAKRRKGQMIVFANRKGVGNKMEAGKGGGQIEAGKCVKVKGVDDEVMERGI
jgi:hypothetical protein